MFKALLLICYLVFTRSLDESVQMAQKMLSERNGIITTKNRLVAMILFAHKEPKPKQSLLRCSLELLAKNVMANSKATGTQHGTQLDIFVWVPKSFSTPRWLENMTNVYVMNIPEEAWTIPKGLPPFSSWVMSYRFPLEYFKMGRWRLTFSFKFVSAMGYRYMLQIDDDTFVMSPVNYNIIETLTKGNNSNSFLFAAWDRYDGETRQVWVELPEFVAAWVKKRSYQKKICGPLLEHFENKVESLAGITTIGWDKQIIRGNFNIWDMDFINSEIVQEFLQDILATGKDITQRWQEQAVYNMIRLLFVPDSRVFFFKDVKIEHKLHGFKSITELCPAVSEDNS